MQFRITNLRLGAGNPAQFCSCGIGNFIPAGVDLDYIVFVDSITGLPIPGFDGFEFLASAGVSWEDVDPQTFNWAGFVSDVNDSGLIQDHAVDLVIRGSKFAEFCINEILGEFNGVEFFGPSILAALAFGTDEWNPVGDALMESHNDITYLSDVPLENWRYQYVPESYFTQLDNLINSVPKTPSRNIGVFPNPASGHATVSGLLPGDSVFLLSSTGAEVMVRTALNTTLTLPTDDLPAGLYMVVIQSNGQSRSLKLMVR